MHFLRGGQWGPGLCSHPTGPAGWGGSRQAELEPCHPRDTAYLQAPPGGAGGNPGMCLLCLYIPPPPQQLCPGESCGARGHSGSDARAFLPFTGTSEGHVLTQYLVSALEAAQGLCCWLYCPGAWWCSPALLAPRFEAAPGVGTLQVLHLPPAIGLLFFSPVYASLS